MNRTMPLMILLALGLVNSLPGDTVTLNDGSRIVGTVIGNAREIVVKTPGGDRTVAVEQVQSIRFGDVETALPPVTAPAPPVTAPAPPVAAPAPPVTVPALPAANFTLPVGTQIAIRTIDAIDSKTGDLDKEYVASLDDPVIVNNVTVLPAKANAVLRIVQIKQAGRLTGSTTLSLRLLAIYANGQKIAVETEVWGSSSDGKGKATVRDGAIGVATGCGIGAAVGGPVGCGVGGALGGATGGLMSGLTGKTVKIDPETRIAFRLSQPVSIGESLEAIVNRGEQYAKNKQYAEALQEYQKALDTKRASSLAHYRVAQVFFDQQNWQSAANEFREALRGDLLPQWTEVWAHLRLGQIFDLTNQRERAMNEYLAAVRTNDITDGAQDAAARYIKAPYQRESQ